MSKSSFLIAFLLSTTVMLTGQVVAQVTVDTTTAGAFIDISATGTALGLTDDGEIDFASSFLGTNIRVGNNGGFAIEAAGGTSQLGFFNGALPDGGAFLGNEVFLPFWDDLDSDIGDVYVEDLGDRLVVQWNNRPHFNGAGATDGATFQAQVFGRESTTAAGDVFAQFVYLDTTFDDLPAFNDGVSATIGYQSDAAFGIEFSNNTASVFGGDVLTFRTATAIPEPGSMLVLGIAGIGLMVRRRKR